MRSFSCESWDDLQAVHHTKLVHAALTFTCVSRCASPHPVLRNFRRKPRLPFVSGTEVSGVVMEAAQDVFGFCPCDRVAAVPDWGGFDEEPYNAVTTWRVSADVNHFAALHCVRNLRDLMLRAVLARTHESSDGLSFR